MYIVGDQVVTRNGARGAVTAIHDYGGTVGEFLVVRFWPTVEHEVALCDLAHVSPLQLMAES
jgi:hypothetical protein